MVWCLIRSSRASFSSLGCFLLADITLSCVTTLCAKGDNELLLFVLLFLTKTVVPDIRSTTVLHGFLNVCASILLLLLLLVYFSFYILIMSAYTCCFLHISPNVPILFLVVNLSRNTKITAHVLLSRACFTIRIIWRDKGEEPKSRRYMLCT